MPIQDIVSIEKISTYKDLFDNYGLIVTRGEFKQEYRFTLADLPFMNPMDWISCYNILSTVYRQNASSEMKVVREHMRLMVKSYLHLFSRVDVEIAEALGYDLPKLKLDEVSPVDFADGEIIEKPWSIVIGLLDDHHSLKCWKMKIDDMYALNKSTMETICTRLPLVRKNKDSPLLEETVKRFKWWVAVRRLLVPVANKMKDPK